MEIFQFRPEEKVYLHVVASIPCHSIEWISLMPMSYCMHLPLYHPWYSTFQSYYSSVPQSIGHGLFVGGFGSRDSEWACRHRVVIIIIMIIIACIVSLPKIESIAVSFHRMYWARQVLWSDPRRISSYCCK